MVMVVVTQAGTGIWDGRHRYVSMCPFTHEVGLGLSRVAALLPLDDGATVLADLGVLLYAVPTQANSGISGAVYEV